MSVCPCTIVEPCSYACSCASQVMSGGCSRCATYGSEEQQLAHARYIAEKLSAPAEVEALVQNVVAAARVTLNEQRREFARGDIVDIDDLEDALKALDAARSPRGALLDGDLAEQRKIHDQSLPQHGSSNG